MLEYKTLINEKGTTREIYNYFSRLVNDLHLTIEVGVYKIDRFTKYTEYGVHGDSCEYLNEDSEDNKIYRITAYSIYNCEQYEHSINANGTPIYSSDEKKTLCELVVLVKEA